MRRPKKRTVAWVGAVAVLLALLALSGPERPQDQTRALRSFLTNSGFDVREEEALPERDGTYVLLSDFRDQEETKPILDWVRGGGRLVVTDPLSSTLSEAGGAPAGAAGFVGTAGLTPQCVAPSAEGVRRIMVRGSEATLDTIRPRSTWCFPKGNGAYLVEIPVANGTIVALGGAGPFTDQLLAQEDNAVLALRVFGGGRTSGSVVFGPPVPAGGSGEGLWHTVPNLVRVLIFEIAIAALLFALVRGRRHGKPVIEEPVESIPAGELVVATAALYRRAHTAGYAGGVLRGATRAKIGRRTGLDPASPRFADNLAAMSGLSSHRVERAFDGPAPENDDQLLALARELDDIENRMEGAMT